MQGQRKLVPKVTRAKARPTDFYLREIEPSLDHRRNNDSHSEALRIFRISRQYAVQRNYDLLRIALHACAALCKKSAVDDPARLFGIIAVKAFHIQGKGYE